MKEYSLLELDAAKSRFLNNSNDPPNHSLEAAWDASQSVIDGVDLIS